MAIKFLTGLDVTGNVDLNTYELKDFRVDNLAADPTGAEGRLYYNTGSDVLRLYANGSWVDLSTGSDDNTTYELFGVGSTNGTAGVQLDGSDGTLDNVLIVGAGTVGVTRSGNTLTVTGTDSAAGTVTSVAGGTGITISGTATITPTVNITTTGASNAIEVLTSATAVGSDYMWFSDVNDSNTLRKSLISALPGYGADGTVTSVTAGAGLEQSGTSTVNPTILVDYTGSDNVILSGADGTAVTLAGTDKVLFNDATDDGAKYANLSQVATYINAGAGSVTSVGLTETGSALTITNSPITSSGNMNIAGAGTSSQVILGDLSLATLPVSGVTSIAISSNYFTIGSSPITSSGTISVNMPNSGVTAASYTNTSLTVNAQGIITAASSGTETDTTYTLPVAAGASNTAIINLTAGGSGSGVASSVTFAGTTAEVAVTESTGNNGTVTIGLPDDVTITGELTVSGTGQSSFGGQVTIPTTPSAGTDAASKTYVDTAILNSGTFQGGYNAATNTPDLDVAPSSSIQNGWFWAVTTAGTFFTEDVQAGDWVFANTDNPGATFANWTVVQSGQEVATAASTDGASTKGISGFDSDTFSVTSNGWVQIAGSWYNPTIGTDTDLDTSNVDVVDQINVTDGVITSMSKRTLPTTSQANLGVVEMATDAEVTTGSSQILGISPDTLKTHLDKQSYTGTWPATGTDAWSIPVATHGLSTGPFIIQCFDSTGNILYIQTAINGSGDISFACTASQTASTITVNIMKVR